MADSTSFSHSQTNQITNNFSVPRMSTKLSDELNYPEWANEAEMFLTVMELFDIVDGTIKRPTTTGNDLSTDQSLWKKASMKAKIFMMYNCEEAAKAKIMLCSTAKDAWDSLRSSYEGKTRTNLHYLLTSVTNMKYDDRTTSIDAHIADFEKRWSRLAATTKSSTDPNSAGGVLFAMTECETLKSNLLLGTLPSFYSNIVDNITTKTEISYSDTTVRLRELVPRKRPNRTESTSSTASGTAPAAFTANSPTNPWNNGKICNYCRANKGWSGRGHLESECRNKKRDEQQTRQQSHTAEEFVFMAETSTNIENKSTWAYDTEASSHMTPHRELLSNTTPCEVPVRTASGWTTATTRGTATIFQRGRIIHLTNTLHIPSLPKNLLSGQRLRRNGAFTYLDQNPRIQQNGKTVIELQEKNGKFWVVNESLISEVYTVNDADEWHERYGHLPFPSFIHIQEAPPMLHRQVKPCDACQQGKSTRSPSPAQHTIRTTEPLELLHSDLCGPMRTATPSKHLYMISLVDDFSRMTLVRSILHKSNAANELLSMISAFETSTGKRTQALKTDNGGEYRSNFLVTELKKRGIMIKETVPHHSQTNPVAERTNRTIFTMARTALIHSKLPRTLWGEAIQHCAYTKNRTPHKALNGKAPLEIFKPKSDIVNERSNFRAFGEPVWIHQLTETDKLAPRASKGFIVNYTPSFKTYRVWTENQTISITKSPRHRDITSNSSEDLVIPNHSATNPFVNQNPISPESSNDIQLAAKQTDNSEWWKATGATSFPKAIQILKNDENAAIKLRDEAAQSGPVGSEPEVKPRRSERIHKKPDRFGYESVHLAESQPTMEEAMNGPHASEWRDAIEQEKIQLRKFSVYEEVEDIPEGKRVVDTKWVLKEKRDENGVLIRRKARLTGRGFMQVPGVDFDSTYAPVARPESWRLLIVLALRDKWEIQQLDVVAAYLNADLKHELYVKDAKVTGTKAWRLCKALYGLKQAASEWNTEMTGILSQAGLQPLKSDPACYIGKGIRMASHVDDYLVTVEEKSISDELIESLEKAVGLEVKGIPRKFLGMECHWTENSVTLTQTQAIEALCDAHNITFGATTPLQPDCDTSEATDQDELIDRTTYQRLIGSLLYISQMTRPDIMHVVSVLARRNAKAARRHWEAALRLLRYLHQTKAWGHTLRGGDGICVWVDASYGGENGRSQTGTVTCFGETAIGWSSRKQDVVSLSVTEAEYIALTAGAQDAIWVKQLLAELGEVSTPEIVTDNAGAQQLSKNPGFHRRTKHIAIRYHYIREQLSKGELTINWKPGKINKADLLTKPVVGPRLKELSTAVLGSSLAV